MKENKNFIGFIYKIYNDVNNKIYIGMTTSTIEKRLICHKHCSKKRTNCKSHLYEAMRKYGEDKFHIECLEEIHTNKKDLCDREIYWISYFDSTNKNVGYNIDTGGRGGDIIHLLSEDRQKEIKLKLRNKNIGKKQSQETITKRTSKIKGRITINKDGHEKRVPKEFLSQYLDNGWSIGASSINDSTRHQWQRNKDKIIATSLKISNSNKGKLKGLIKVVNENNEEIRIKPNELEYYQTLGYKRGQKSRTVYSHKGQILMLSGDVKKYIQPTLIDEYLKDGWIPVSKKWRKKYVE